MAALATPALKPPAVDVSTARSAINTILAPIIKQIRAAATARATSGQQMISGYTNNAQDQLKGLDFATPYAGAESGENAINTALLARLTGAGSGLQSELGGKLAGIGAPNAAAITGGIGSTAAAAGNAGLAKGDATLSALLSEGAAAKTYGAKLPAITSLAGAQDTGKLQGQVASDEASQLSDLQSKVPGMVQSELTSLTSARTAAQKNAIAVALAENIDPVTGQLTQKGKDEIRRVNIEQQNANTSATRANNSQANADRNYQLAKDRLDNSSKQKASASVSKELGYLADSTGKPILLNGNRVAIKTSGTNGLTANESAGMQAKAEKDAEDLYHGKSHTTAAGQTIVDAYSVPYGQAITTLSQRYPKLGRAAIIKLVNSLYPAGQLGRPQPPPPAYGTSPAQSPNG